MSKSAKKKRAPNFTPDEKLMLVHLVQKYGHAIVQKLTSNNSDSSYQKENEWKKIAEKLNAARNSNRTTFSLKNVWKKLKIETRVYRRAQRGVSEGTGSSTPRNNTLYDLVYQLMTGQGSSQHVMNWDHSISLDAAPLNNTTTTSLFENLDCDDTLHTVKHDDIPEEDVLITSNDSETDLSDDSDVMVDDEPEIELPSNNAKTQPASSVAFKERNAVDLVRAKLMCKLADEKLLTQREKKKIILLQQQQMTELHNAKLENERLKKMLYKNLIRKVKSGEITAVARKTTLEDILKLESI